MVIKSQKTLKRKTDKHIREQSDGKRSRGGEGGKRAGKLGGQRHVRYTRFTITRRGRSLSPVIRELFCQSVRSLSVRPLPTNRLAGPCVRLLWLLTRDLRATSFRSSYRAKRRTNTPLEQRLRPRRLRVCGSLWRHPYECAKLRGTSG